jgi:hypothetical protein
MAEEFKQDKTNRRGCFLLVAGIVLALAVLSAFGFGLFESSEGGKITDLPIMDGGTPPSRGTPR